MYPLSRLHNYISNTRSSLKKTEFHDSDIRIIHFVFDALVEFVEVEMADRPWWAKFVPWVYRDPQSGMRNLRQDAMIYNNKEDRTNNSWSSLNEVLALYKWWCDNKDQCEYEIAAKKCERVVQLMGFMWT